MEKIKCISRNWRFPTEPISEFEQAYEVGLSGVISIEAVEQCFCVYFKDGQTISLTDVNYVEWIKEIENETDK